VVCGALQSLGDPKSRSAFLHRSQERELDGRVVRRLREALRDMGDHKTAAEAQSLTMSWRTCARAFGAKSNGFPKVEAGKGQSPQPAARAKKPARGARSKRRGQA